MRGTVKFFNALKGWGFLTDSEGKDLFFHHSNIIMPGFRSLEEGDIVNFESDSGTDGREQAVKVTPILTMKMVRKTLNAEHLHTVIKKDAYGVEQYLVVDANNVIQSSEQGMSLVELAAYAGIDVSGLEE